MHSRFPKLSSVGLSGLAISFADTLSEAANRAALAFRAAVEQQGWESVEECSTSLCSTFIRFDPLAAQSKDLPAVLSDLMRARDWFAAPLPTGRRHFHIPCVFGGSHGPQFDDAAAAAGLSTAEALTSLTAARPRVLTIGFAPGQPYTGQLGPEWDIPRLSELTRSVPQGALVIAIRQLIIFSNATPTGWRHIGQTAFRCFQPEGDDPFALRPGDEVSFAAISPEILANIQADPKAGNGGARIERLS